MNDSFTSLDYEKELNRLLDKLKTEKTVLIQHPKKYQYMRLILEKDSVRVLYSLPGREDAIIVKNLYLSGNTLLQDEIESEKENWPLLENSADYKPGETFLFSDEKVKEIIKDFDNS